MRHISTALLLVIGFLWAMPSSSQWSAMGPSYGDIHSSVSFADTLIVGTACGLYRSLDNGSTFAPHSKGMPSGSVIALHRKGEVLFACVQDKGIYASLDRGVTWSLSLQGRYLTATVAQAYIEQAGTTIFVKTYLEDSLYFSDDDGATWIGRPTSVTPFVSVSGAGGRIFASSYSGSLGATDGLYWSDDQNVTWNLCAGVPAGTYIFRVRQVGATIHAIGQHVFTSTDGGDTFQQTTVTPAGFGPAYLSFDGTRFHAQNGGNIFLQQAMWQPGATSWTVPTTPAPSEGGTITFFNHDTYTYLSKVGSLLYRTANGGATWTDQPYDGINSREVHDLFVDGTGALAGSDAVFLIAGENDPQWTQSDISLTLAPMHSVVRTSTGIVAGFLSGSELTLVYTSTNNGASWTSNDFIALHARRGTWMLRNDTIVAFGTVGVNNPTLYLLNASGTLVGTATNDANGWWYDPASIMRSVAWHHGQYYGLVNGEFGVQDAVLWRGFPTWQIVTTQIDGVTLAAAAIASFNDLLYIGMAHGGGVKVSDDDGASWTTMNAGLGDVSPRSFLTTDNYLFMTSDKGVYYLPIGDTTWVNISGDLLVGEIAEVCVGSTYLWVRADKGGVWRLPLLGNVSVSDPAASMQPLSIAPNPASNMIRIAMNPDANGIVIITDPLGRVVKSQRVGSGQQTLTLDISELEGGTYLCVLTVKGSKRSARFVKR